MVGHAQGTLSHARLTDGRDLYIRALLVMQQANYTDTLSYFQIEGMPLFQLLL